MADDLDWRHRGRAGPDPSFPSLRTAPTSAAAPLSVGGRLRIARGMPQAVLKVLSYRRGADAVRRTLAYIAGKAGDRIVVEGDLMVEGKEARAALLADWSRDFSTRTNGRDVAHLEVSAPPGSDRAKLHAAARAFATETFGATHQFALAEHRDTAHPHCHMLVKLKGHDGRMLDPRKATLARWRETFAKAARAQGLLLDASPRMARGAPPRSRSRSRIAIDQRGASASNDAAQQQRQRPTEHNPHAAARLRDRLGVERDEFYRAAQRLSRTADINPNPADRRRYQGMAQELVAFGDKLGTLQRTPRAALETAMLRQRDKDVDLDLTD